MRTCSVHHVALTVSDLERSKGLYSGLLGLLGYSLHVDSDSVLAWTGPYPEILLYKARIDQVQNKHSTYDPGIHHLAFSAESIDIVQRAFELARDFGCVILDEPRKYPSYGLSYFATYFLDPDGIKLEFAFNDE